MFKKTNDSIKSTTFYIFLIRILRLLVTLITLPLTANFFGISIERDSWILVSTFITTFGLLIWGAIDETFRAKFIDIKERESENLALLKASSLVYFSILVSLVLCIILFFFSDQISNIIDNSERKQNVELITILIHFLIPSLILNQLISICIGILNSYEVYFIPEIAGLVASFVNLFLIVFLAPSIGIYSLLISHYFSIFLILFFLIIYFKKLNIKLSSFFKMKFSHVKLFLVFALPFFFPYFAGQINNIFEKIIANSLGQGSVSILDYAKQFSSILQVVISGVLTTVMLPILAKNYSSNDQLNFSKILNDNISVIFVIMSVSVTLLIGASDLICDFFFNNGEIDKKELKILVNLTRLYGFGLISIIFYLIFGITLLASGKSKIYAFVGVFCQIIVFSINFMFSESIGLEIFPISILLGHFFAVVLLSFYLNVTEKKKFFLGIIKKLIIVLFISFFVYILNLNPIFSNSFFQLVFDFFIVLFLLFIFSKSLEFSFSPFVSLKK